MASPLDGRLAGAEDRNGFLSYGLEARFGLLSTSPLGNAVTFSYRSQAWDLTGTCLPADRVRSKAHRRISLAVDNARLYGLATDARVAAEALAADVTEQSRAVEAALLAMRAEWDAALARIAVLERERAERSGPA